jgi:transcription initiation factor TFIID subunit 11
VPKSQEEGGGEPKPQKHLGPLQPAHLREAFRRYRRDGEGGGAGVEGFSVGLGLPGTGAARIGGRRLFR